MSEVLKAVAIIGFIIASGVLLWNFYRIFKAFREHSGLTG